MATETESYGLVKPADGEFYDVGVGNGNMDKIDAAMKPTADPSQVPTGLVGKLSQWVSWIANRIKAITGKPNWYDAPDITLATLNAHKSRHANGGDDALTPDDISAFCTDKGNLHDIEYTSLLSVTTPGSYFIWEADTFLSDFPGFFVSEHLVYGRLHVLSKASYIQKIMIMGKAAGNLHKMAFCFDSHWHLLANAESPTELDIPFVNSLTTQPTYKSKYWKNAFNEVSIDVRYQKTGTSNDIASGIVMFTLPAGFRPTENIVILGGGVTSTPTDIINTMIINTAGVCTIYSSSSVNYMLGHFVAHFIGG